MKRLVATAVAAAALLGVSVSSASAATYGWSFVCTSGGAQTCGSGGSGLLTTNNPIGSDAVVQSISGLWDGNPINALLAPSTYGNDNKIISLLSPELNANGIAFSSGGLDWRMYFPSGGPSDLIQTHDSLYPCGLTCRGEFSVSLVPIPAGAWLLLSALGGLGFAGWRRKRAVAA